MNLVTGATGHIGNVLVRELLNQGQAVRALVQPGESPCSLQGLPVETVQGDVLDETSIQAAMEGIKRVYHLAGVITIMPGPKPIVHKVNVEGTKNVLRAAHECGVKRVVYTSSIHAVKRIEEGVVDESLPYDAHNPYGVYDRSKAEATLEVLKAAQLGQDTVVACPTGVIGPYDFLGSMMGAIIRDAAAAKPILYVDGAYDFVDVRDVAAGLIAIADQGACGESYILSGSKISVRYLLETVREITGRGFFQMKVPGGLAKVAALFTPVYYRLAHAIPRFTPYSLEVLRSNSNISHAKATRELGYQPRHLYETIVDTLHWLRQQRIPTPTRR